MQLARLGMVQRAAAERDRLIRSRDLGTIRIEIDGVLQDAETVEFVRPTMALLINRRIAELETDLEQLGVELA